MELPLKFNLAGSARAQPRASRLSATLVIRYLLARVLLLHITETRCLITLPEGRDDVIFDFATINDVLHAGKPQSFSSYKAPVEVQEQQETLC